MNNCVDIFTGKVHDGSGYILMMDYENEVLKEMEELARLEKERRKESVKRLWKAFTITLFCGGILSILFYGSLLIKFYHINFYVNPNLRLGLGIAMILFLIAAIIQYFVVIHIERRYNLRK